MEPIACRERLRQLIVEEATALDELAVLLAREHEHLTANDVAALDQAIRERQLCVARLVRSEESRRALCRELGSAADGPELERIMRWCDPQGALTEGWGRCSAAAARCRALNDRNGALVSARLRHVEARLTALKQGGGETITYGRRGAYALGHVGRVVKIEA